MTASDRQQPLKTVAAGPPPAAGGLERAIELARGALLSDEHGRLEALKAIIRLGSTR